LKVKKLFTVGIRILRYLLTGTASIAQIIGFDDFLKIVLKQK